MVRSIANSNANGSSGINAVGSGIVEYDGIGTLTGTGVLLDDLTTALGTTYALSNAGPIEIVPSTTGAYVVTINTSVVGAPRAAFCISKSDVASSNYSLQSISASTSAGGAVVFDVTWNSSAGIFVELSAAGFNGDYNVSVIGL